MITHEQVTEAIEEGIDRAHDIDVTHQDYAESAARLVMELIAAEVARLTAECEALNQDIVSAQGQIAEAQILKEKYDAITSAQTTAQDAAHVPEVKALIEAVSAEIEARRKFLSTAPDRGAKNGPKSIRKTALEDAQLRTIAALREIKARQ